MRRGEASRSKSTACRLHRWSIPKLSTRLRRSYRGAIESNIASTCSFLPGDSPMGGRWFDIGCRLAYQLRALEQFVIDVLLAAPHVTHGRQAHFIIADSNHHGGMPFQPRLDRCGTEPAGKYAIACRRGSPSLRMTEDRDAKVDMIEGRVCTQRITNSGGTAMLIPFRHDND